MKNCAEPPTSFCCPITAEVMEDPLMTKSGLSFERSAILEWIGNHNNTCPMTRSPLSPSDLVPNAALRMKIETWRELYGDGSESSTSESSTREDEAKDVFVTCKLSDIREAIRASKQNKPKKRFGVFSRLGNLEG